MLNFLVHTMKSNSPIEKTAYEQGCLIEKASVSLSPVGDLCYTQVGLGKNWRW